MSLHSSNDWEDISCMAKNCLRLYGEKLSAPLRELLQNACDAVRARRLFDDQPNNWGEIRVSLVKKGEQWHLSVADVGIGMSVNVMTGALLDFGTSFWNSAEARKEFPGLAAKKFTPTGRYGIGFFSTFMLGKKVKVISRRFDLGQEDTRVLEFQEGVGSRPLLREADTQERRINGTSVEIVLDSDPYKPGGLLRSGSIEIPQLSLREFCAWLCPAFPVTILVKELDGNWEIAVECNDWMNLPALDLLNRIEKIEDDDDKKNNLNRRLQRAKNLRPVFDINGEIVGRLAFRINNRDSRYMMDDPAVVCVGGSRADSLHYVSGVVAGEPQRASRDRATPSITSEERERWLKEQVQLLQQSDIDPEEKASITPYLVSSDMDTENLPIALTSSGWMSEPEIRSKIAGLSRIVLISPSSLNLMTRNRKVNILDTVIVCESGYYPNLIPLSGDRSGSDSPNRYDMLFGSSIRDVIRGLIVEVWNIDEKQIEKTIRESDDAHSYEATVGLDEYGNPVTDDHVDLCDRSEPDVDPTSRT